MKSASGRCRVPAGRAQLDLRVEDQQRRHAVGGRRGVAEIAGDGAGILDLHGADLARRLLQRIEGRRQRLRGRCRSRSCARRSRNDPAVSAMPRSSAEPVDVEHVFAERPGALRRIEIGAARQDPPRASPSRRALRRRSWVSRSGSRNAFPAAAAGEIHSYANDIKRRGIVKAIRSARHSVHLMAHHEPNRKSHG